jgi:hypothetical protein
MVHRMAKAQRVLSQYGLRFQVNLVGGQISVDSGSSKFAALLESFNWFIQRRVDAKAFRLLRSRRAETSC